MKNMFKSVGGVIAISALALSTVAAAPADSEESDAAKSSESDILDWRCDSSVEVLLCDDPLNTDIPPDQPMISPVIEPVDDAMSLIELLVASANPSYYQCVYETTNHADGGRTGDFDSGNSGFAVYSDLQSDVIGELQSGALIGPYLYGTVWTEVGVWIAVGSDWPETSRVNVAFHYDVDGNMHIDTDYAPVFHTQSHARARYLAAANLERNSIGVTPTVIATDVLGPGLPGRDHAVVSESGATSHTIDSPPNSSFRAYVYQELELEADGQLGVSAAARGDFAYDYRGANLRSIRFTWEVPAGYTVVDCGNGTKPV